MGGQGPSLSDILDKLEIVTTDDFHTLGIHLGIKHRQLDTIYNAYRHNPAQIKPAIIQYWKKNSKKCSWGALATALKKVGKYQYQDLVDTLRDLDGSSESEDSTSAEDKHTPRKRKRRKRKRPDVTPTPTPPPTPSPTCTPPMTDEEPDSPPPSWSGVSVGQVAGYVAGKVAEYFYNWFQGPSNSKKKDSDAPSSDSESDNAQPERKRQKMT